MTTEELIKTIKSSIKECCQELFPLLIKEALAKPLIDIKNDTSGMRNAAEYGFTYIAEQMMILNEILHSEDNHKISNIIKNAQIEKNKLFKTLKKEDFVHVEETESINDISDEESAVPKKEKKKKLSDREFFKQQFIINPKFREIWDREIDFVYKGKRATKETINGKRALEIFKILTVDDKKKISILANNHNEKMTITTEPALTEDV